MQMTRESDDIISDGVENKSSTTISGSVKNTD